MDENQKFIDLTYATFKANPYGAEWIELMKENFIEKVAVADPSKDEKHAYYREGQNSIIRAIVNNIKVHEESINKNKIQAE